MERGAKRHRVDRQEPIIGQNQDDHLEQVPGSVRADGQFLGRIAVGIEVDDNQRGTSRVTDAASATPCRRAERWISTRQYCNTQSCASGARSRASGALGPLAAMSVLGQVLASWRLWCRETSEPP